MNRKGFRYYFDDLMYYLKKFFSSEGVRKGCLFFYYLFIVIWFECVYRMTLFKNIIDSDFIEMIIFSIPVAVLLYFIGTLINKKVNKIVSGVIITLLYVLFFAQMVYYQVYDSVFSVYALGNGGQVLQFWSTIVTTITSSLYNYICLTVPVILYFILSKKYFNFEKNSLKVTGLTLLIFIFLNSICLGYINNDRKAIYSSYNLYFNTSAPVLSSKKFGLLSTMSIDLRRVMFGMVEKKIEIEVEPEEKNEPEVVEVYNTLDIDFDELIKNESNDTINSLHSYFSNTTGTKKNDYTGMFEGKNVVFILAESLDPIAINEDLTPTLYKLANSGFNFSNYYAPKYPASTADGEFRTEWSLISSRGDTKTLYSYRNVYNPNLFVNSFSDYNINIYHNYNGDYYQRREYFKALGYKNFKACYYGLKMSCGSFHESDLEMVEASINDYINSDEPFFAYYITISGHLSYVKSTNKMIRKNWDLVKDLPYSDTVKGYLAGNIETDRAVEKIISSLEEAGKLDDTVIVITPDHYPYGLSNDELNEVSLINRDDPFEMYHSDLIIWNSEMKETINIDKVGSNPDVLPTLLNLFGKDYDSRLMMGQDLLSDKEGLVVLANRSFITDTARYNSVTDEVIVKDNLPIEENYISRMNNLVDNQFKISTLILQNNYYKKVYDSLKQKEEIEIIEKEGE